MLSDYETDHGTGGTDGHTHYVNDTISFVDILIVLFQYISNMGRSI
jgi:hypothetical protein